MIKFKNIDLKFNDKIILKDFNLTINKGEKVLIAGKSGKGKSTLLKILLGFNSPDSGEVLFQNIQLNEKNIDNIRKYLGYMPQSTPFLNDNVEKIINTIFNYKLNSKKKLDYDKLFYYFNLFNLDKNILTKHINELSGGEKQRFAFIITILLDREVWILDEITSSLDQDMKEKVTHYILNSDKTVVLVSHDQTESLQKFRRVTL
ncbi:MAG: ABC transporter ATP-binding protein [Cetobacterium sp.]|uniref:ABC transporter ATP-binding protein n=1 Tax=Cetobacterium sp. TaxID=2071632 RepID=UPI0025EFF2F5|nr:ATP-binding cassette domain-containing protein [uncultured Cetobacterium sp.]